MAELYTIRSHKRIPLSSELPWSNTYEVFSEAPAVPEQAQGGMEAVRVFERALTFETVEFWHATFSSWRQEEREDDPPDELFPYLGPAQLGSRSAVAAPAPLTDCLHIARIPQRGNKGKIFLRGCFENAEIQVTARRRILAPAALPGYTTYVDAAWEALQLNLASFGLSLGMFALPRIGWEPVPVLPGRKPKYRPVYGTTPQLRQVKELRAVGMTPVQLRHN